GSNAGAARDERIDEQIDGGAGADANHCSLLNVFQCGLGRQALLCLTHGHLQKRLCPQMRAQFRKNHPEGRSAASRVRPYFFFAAFFLAFFFAFAMLASPVNRVSPMSEYIDAKLNYKTTRS